MKKHGLEGGELDQGPAKRKKRQWLAPPAHQTHTRVGSAFQAEIPAFSPPAEPRRAPETTPCVLIARCDPLGISIAQEFLKLKLTVAFLFAHATAKERVPQAIFLDAVEEEGSIMTAGMELERKCPKGVAVVINNLYSFSDATVLSDVTMPEANKSFQSSLSVPLAIFQCCLPLLLSTERRCVVTLLSASEGILQKAIATAAATITRCLGQEYATNNVIATAIVLPSPSPEHAPTIASMILSLGASQSCKCFSLKGEEVPKM